MKLKKIENENLRKKEATLNVSKNGTMQFSPTAGIECDLGSDIDQKGVNFYQDEEDSQNWFIEVVTEGSVKMRYSDDYGPRGSSASIAKKIRESTCNPPDKSVRCLIGKVVNENGLKVHPLLINKGSHRYN